MDRPEIRSVSAVSVGDIWTAVITGVRHIHSLIIEAWGANGGITRILPQGRDEVKVELRFQAPGRTSLFLTLRDDRLGASHAFETAIDVTPPGAPLAYAAERVWHGPIGGRLDALPGAPAFQTPAYGGLSGPIAAVLRERVRVRFSLPEPGLTVKFYATNAVVDFVGPMPVEEISAETGVEMTEVGTATIFAEAFDKIGNMLTRATHAIQVSLPNQDSPRGMSSPDGRGGTFGYGSLVGPAVAKLSEKIFVRFNLPERGLTVKFYATNAVVDFVGPMPVEEISAETGVEMTQEGTATIFAEAFDKIGNMLTRASHAVQVVVDRQDRPSPASSINDLAADMQRSLEASLRARLIRD